MTYNCRIYRFPSREVFTAVLQIRSLFPSSLRGNNCWFRSCTPIPSNPTVKFIAATALDVLYLPTYLWNQFLLKIALPSPAWRSLPLGRTEQSGPASLCRLSSSPSVPSRGPTPSCLFPLFISIILTSPVFLTYYFKL